MFRSLLLGLIVFIIPYCAHAASLQHIRSSANGTVIELSVSDPSPYRVFLLDDPLRLVVDLKDAHESEGCSKVLVHHKNLIKRVRIGKQPGYLRVVFDLQQPIYWQVERQSSGRALRLELRSLRSTHITPNYDIPMPHFTHAAFMKAPFEAPPVEVRPKPVAPPAAPQSTAVPSNAPKMVPPPAPGAAPQPPSPSIPAPTPPPTLPVAESKAPYESVTSITLTRGIEMKSSSAQTPKPAIPTPPVVATPASTPTSPIPAPGAPRNNVLTTGRNVVIVIDPGHGGNDSGAIGRYGHQEKEIVLNISRRLQQLLNQQKGIEAYLTRDDDVFLNLRERLQRARSYKADIFVSVHADAFKQPMAQGSSLYVLSPRGASSEAARWLAEKENNSELKGKGEIKDALLRSVLLDLSQTATIGTSVEIGNQVLRSLSKVNQLHYPKVEQARFVVLKSPDIASMLVETGFISNPYEEQRLTTDYYQQQLAQAIAEGILNYISFKPISGTYFAVNRLKTGIG